MIEVKGTCNTAKIFTDTCDSATIAQVTNLMNQPSVAGAKVRIMPDCHAGAGCVIGTTMTVKDKVIPNLVGVDIGCGMRTPWRRRCPQTSSHVTGRAAAR